MKRPPTTPSHRTTGLTIIEVLIAVAILGIRLAAVIPSFLTNMRINTDSEVKSQAVTAAQTMLDSLRADGAWPEYGLDPDGEQTIPPVHQVESGGRTFDVQIDYGPYCDASGTCLEGAQYVELEVRWRGQVYYTVETVYTDLRWGRRASRGVFREFPAQPRGRRAAEDARSRCPWPARVSGAGALRLLRRPGSGVPDDRLRPQWRPPVVPLGAGAQRGCESSSHGVRVRNGADLLATSAGAPEIHGLTVVTDQAAFVQGDYNLNPDWRPASFIADTVNILSNAWDDDADSIGLDQRGASPTTVNAAFLGGTDATGGADGENGQSGTYSGGLENYPRFHERWGGTTFTYRGSFVNLGEPQHANGPWRIGNVYTPPERAWNYDVRFNQAQNLPPLSPRFVYLVQEQYPRLRSLNEPTSRITQSTGPPARVV